MKPIHSLLALAMIAGCANAQHTQNKHLNVSGIYPHLASFNQPAPGERGGGECGIGALVPWAGKLWWVTYSPHEPRGSADKLYAMDAGYNLTVRPESIGGTPASRMIHKESNQLFIASYAIDAKGRVRVIPFERMPGRMTAAARHLTDPANKLYIYDMEGALYEVGVHDLDVKRLFRKPVPGWHGKGAYTGQGRLILSNNGDHPVDRNAYKELQVGAPPQSAEEIGCLAEWDGKTWRIVRRKQFVDITGPGGIHGAPDDEAPVWAMGWDRRSVKLMLLDDGRWSEFLLPKGSFCNDTSHGWYTEWPRIREIGRDDFLMDMHGTFFDFPPGFANGEHAGIRPVSTHLRYVPDFCEWDGQLVLAADDAAVVGGNKMCGQSQSNLWFGQYDDLKTFGPRNGYGGPWVNDAIEKGEPSKPYLFAGYDHRVLHLVHDAKQTVRFTVELDRKGDGQWAEHATFDVGAGQYVWHAFPRDLKAEWVRLKADTPCKATAYFHYHSYRKPVAGEGAVFEGLFRTIDSMQRTSALIRPAKHNRNLQVLTDDGEYFEVDQTLTFSAPAQSRADEVARIAAIEPYYTVEDASVVVTENGKRYRLPKASEVFDLPEVVMSSRHVREVQSERELMNVHGTFYELPKTDWIRKEGVKLIRPVSTHDKLITDYCNWRGMLVMSGVKKGATTDGNTFMNDGRGFGLWFGMVDDLWKLGEPRGYGGPWLNTKKQPGKPSDPYLMTGYDHKVMTLSHDADGPVAFTVEVDFDHQSGWHTYGRFVVKPGERFEHTYPTGYSAHWVRLKVDKPCRATAQFKYNMRPR